MLTLLSVILSCWDGQTVALDRVSMSFQCQSEGCSWSLQEAQEFAARAAALRAEFPGATAIGLASGYQCGTFGWSCFEVCLREECSKVEGQPELPSVAAPKIFALQVFASRSWENAQRALSSVGPFVPMGFFWTEGGYGRGHQGSVEVDRGVFRAIAAVYATRRKAESARQSLARRGISSFVREIKTR